MLPEKAGASQVKAGGVQVGVGMGTGGIVRTGTGVVVITGSDMFSIWSHSVSASLTRCCPAEFMIAGDRLGPGVVDMGTSTI